MGAPSLAIVLGPCWEADTAAGGWPPPCFHLLLIVRSPTAKESEKCGYIFQVLQYWKTHRRRWECRLNERTIPVEHKLGGTSVITLVSAVLPAHRGLTK